MAEAGSWPQIRDHGLLSTSALLDRYQISGPRREVIEKAHRPECVTIIADGLPDAIVRDQKPMSDGALSKCLQDGLTPSEWYRILNARTFFWASRQRLRGLLGARAYRDRPQTVLTVDTRSLVEAYRDRIELSPINSGSTIFKPAPRGHRTFQSIDQYDYRAWRDKRGPENAIVELVVRGGIPDIRDHVLAVHEVRNGLANPIWRRPGTSSDIGP
jgi:hypothetical protein